MTEPRPKRDDPVAPRLTYAAHNNSLMYNSLDVLAGVCVLFVTRPRPGYINLFGTARKHCLGEGWMLKKKYTCLSVALADPNT